MVSRSWTGRKSEPYVSWVFWWRLAREVEKLVPDFFVMVLLYAAASFDSVKLNRVDWKAG